MDACLAQKPPVRMALGSLSRASLTLRQDRSLVIRETLGSRGLSPQSHLLFMGQGVLSKDRISETCGCIRCLQGEPGERGSDRGNERKLVWKLPLGRSSQASGLQAAMVRVRVLHLKDRLQVKGKTVRRGGKSEQTSPALCLAVALRRQCMT